MKKITLVLMCILILPTSLVFAEGDEDVDIQIEFDFLKDVEDIKSRSSDIVQLEILNKRAEWINPWEGFEGEKPDNWQERYELYTIHRARVLNVFQGDSGIGEIIEVRQLGGSLDGANWTTPSTANFSYGDNVVLFLIEVFSSLYGIMSPFQGSFIVNDDGELLSYHNHPADSIELTWEILEQIQSDNGIDPEAIISENNEVEARNDVENDYTENNNVERSGAESSDEDSSDAESSGAESSNAENSDVESGSVENSDIESNGIVRIGTAIVGAVLAILLVVLIMRNRKKRINS